MAVQAWVTPEMTVQLVAEEPGPGKWFRAYAGEPDLLVATTPLAVDRWAPMGVPLVYYWTDVDGVQTVPDTLVVQSDMPALSSATGTGYVSLAVVTQPPLRWEARSQVHDILYRAEPVVTVAPARYHSATLRLHLPDTTVRGTVRALLAKGEPLILRTPCGAAVDDVTFLPLRWTEELVSPAQPAGARWMDVEYQAVMDNPTAYRPLPDWSWDQLDDAHASWTEVEAAYLTWGDVELGPA